MKREHGQSSIEALIVVPVCMTAAWMLVNVGAYAQQRVAVSHAASRAAVARLRGNDPVAAARSGYGRHIAAQVHVQLGTSGAVDVSAPLRITGPLQAVLPARVASHVDSAGGDLR